MIIRAKTFKRWLLANFSKQRLKDIACYGAHVGWPGISLYSETCKLYNKFKEEIGKMLCEDSESFGCGNVFELMSGFRVAKEVDSCTHFENLMVWYAAERLAHQAVDEEE
jgi:hypothetical protein